MGRFWGWLARQQSPITTLAGITGIFAGLSGFGFGLFTILNDEDESPALEQAAVSIERRIGEEAQFYDVRDIIVTPEEVRDKLPESKFFTDDDFYAVPDDALGDDWTYELTTEPEFVALTGVESPPGLAELPLHVWRREIVEVGEPVEANTFDYVFVQRVAHEEVAALVASGFGEPPADPENGVEAGDFAGLEELGEQYRGDSTGVILMSQMPYMLPLGISDVRPVLNTVQKIGNVVYAQSTVEIRDAVVDGEPYDEFFLERELMLISTEDDIWMVRTNVGTPDRRSDSYAWLDDWFLHFGIVGEE
jgi:hypothetical protein